MLVLKVKIEISGHYIVQCTHWVSILINNTKTFAFSGANQSLCPYYPSYKMQRSHKDKFKVELWPFGLWIWSELSYPILRAAAMKIALGAITVSVDLTLFSVEHKMCWYTSPSYLSSTAMWRLNRMWGYLKTQFPGFSFFFYSLHPSLST